MDYREPDDFIHNPDPKRDRKNDQGGDIFTYRGLTNLGCLTVLITGLLALLCVRGNRLDKFAYLRLYVLFAFVVPGILLSATLPSTSSRRRAHSTLVGPMLLDRYEPLACKFISNGLSLL